MVQQIRFARQNMGTEKLDGTVQQWYTATPAETGPAFMRGSMWWSTCPPWASVRGSGRAWPSPKSGRTARWLASVIWQTPWWRCCMLPPSPCRRSAPHHCTAPPRCTPALHPPLHPTTAHHPCTVPIAPRPCTLPLHSTPAPHHCTRPLHPISTPHHYTPPLHPTTAPHPCTPPLHPTPVPHPCTHPCTSSLHPTTVLYTAPHPSTPSLHPNTAPTPSTPSLHPTTAPPHCTCLLCVGFMLMSGVTAFLTCAGTHAVDTKGGSQERDKGW